MRVLCTRLPGPVDGVDIEESPWVSLHAEYDVVALLAEPRGRVQLQILTNDGHSLGWFDSDCFLVVDATLPHTWVARLGEDGKLEFAPEAWLTPGFWESFYDGDPTAVELVDSALRRLLDEGYA
jgi:hypothetical protein